MSSDRNRLRQVSRAALLVALLLATMASDCDSASNGSTPTTPSTQVVSVTITGNLAVVVGATSQLTATATLASGATQDVTGMSSWSSSNTAVATVSATGLLTGVTAGSVTVTVTYQGQTGEIAATIAMAVFGPLQGTSNWAGTWTDTRYNVSGTLTGTITVNGMMVSGTGVIGLQSLGLGDEPGSGIGSIVNGVLNFTFQADTVGNGVGTMNSDGSGSGSGSVTGVLNFGAFTYEGTTTETTITGTFAFSSPTGGFGVATLTRQ